MKPFLSKYRYVLGAGAVALVGLAWLAFGYFGVHTLFIDREVDEALPTFDRGAVVAGGSNDASASDGPSPDADDARPPAQDDADTGTDDTTATDADTRTDDDTATDNDTGGDPDADTGTDNDTGGDPDADTGTVDTGTDRADTGTDAADAEPVIVVEADGSFESLGRYSTSGTALVLGDGSGQRFLRFEEFETTNGPDLNVYLVNSSTGDVSDFVDLGDLSGNIGNQNYEIPPEVDLSVYDTVMIWCVRFSTGFGQASLQTA